MRIGTTEINEQEPLARLTATAQAEHLAVGQALSDCLRHAMAAGDALLAARKLVPAGNWLAHLREHTDISERSARVYIQVARARAELERQCAAGPLSIAAALEFLKDSASSAKTRTGADRQTSADQTKNSKTTSSEALAWWSRASHDARQHFLEGIGLISLLAALPPAFRTEIERRTRNHQTEAGHPNHKLTVTLHTALSHLAVADAPQTSRPVAQSQELAALNALRAMARMHADFHQLTIGIGTAEKARPRRRAA
jgi:hypothetical protein